MVVGPTTTADKSPKVPTKSGNLPQPTTVPFRGRGARFRDGPVGHRRRGPRREAASKRAHPSLTRMMPESIRFTSSSMISPVKLACPWGNSTIT